MLDQPALRLPAFRFSVPGAAGAFRARSALVGLLGLAAILGLPAFVVPAEAASAAAGAATNTQLWRQTHGVLLSVARAGDRLVAAGDRGTVLLSDDQGATWRASPTGTDQLLTSAVFTSPQEGWVVGQDAMILHTTDSGQHWTVQHSEPASDHVLFSVASVGPGHLVATGSYALMLETTNAADWSAVKLPNLDEDYHLNCVTAIGGDVIVTGEAGHVFVRRGTAWTPMPVPYDGSQFGCLTTTDGAMYSFGLRGSLFVSTQAAPAWKRIDTGEQRSIFGGTVLANGFLALVGSNGLVMLLDPQTRTLRTLPPPTTASLSGVVEAAGGSWVAVGDDGVHVIDPAGPVSRPAQAPAPEVTQ